MIYPDILKPYDGIVAFFTDRTEGIDPSRIATLWGMGEGDILFLKQEHTDRIIIVDDKGFTEPLKADGAITEERGVLLSVKVADCVPILMYDPQKNIVAAVHAGWRGTARGIIINAIGLFKDRYNSSPEEILIAMGPSIRWCCYEVDDRVLSLVRERTGEGEFYIIRNGKTCLDLPSANMYQAISEGVPGENIWISGDCTFCYPERYFSYRYNRTRERQGGFIGLI